MKKYDYTIYQVGVNEDFCFMRWEVARRHNWSFDPYKIVWEGTEEARDDYDLLNYLYEVFNERRPSDFRGHSMSVSDIIMICDDDGSTYYYCDSFGWHDITDNVMKEMRCQLC